MKNSDLIQFLRSKECDRYFGRAFVLKAEVLARHFSGKGTLTDIARRHQVTNAALTRHAKRAAEIWPG